MSTSLADLDVIVLDCQASGASPAHGDLLELGWGRTNGREESVIAAAAWVKPATDRPISCVVRKLTGWDDTALAMSVAPVDAWAHVAALARATRTPTVIHFARFELNFLRDLHRTHAPDTDFPLDVICLHAVGVRLFPGLPRRSLRALAGHLGASPQMIRRAQGHVEVSAHVWRALVPMLAAQGVTTWEELQHWLTAAAPVSAKRRAFPISEQIRKGLPAEPGVYRFLRPNGDVLYVGKAGNIKKRIQSHYTAAAGSRTTERALEMLSQAHDVAFTLSPSVLEAALLEADEIKRLDPPYNIHLRQGDRFAWFATSDWQITNPEVTDRHRLGPLPSRTAISGIAAIRALLSGAAPNDALRADAVGVPHPFTPPQEMFDEAWAPFVARELSGPGRIETRILAAGKRIVVKEREDDDAPEGWDVATVTRYLERVVVTEGTLVVRARQLTLLTDADILFREAKSKTRRHLRVSAGAIAEADSSVPQRAPPRRVRQGGFDTGRYDRLRVLATELRRVALEGGDVEVRIGRHSRALGVDSRRRSG